MRKWTSPVTCPDDSLFVQGTECSVGATHNGADRRNIQLNSHCTLWELADFLLDGGTVSHPSPYEDVGGSGEILICLTK